MKDRYLNPPPAHPNRRALFAVFVLLLACLLGCSPSLRKLPQKSAPESSTKP